MHQDSFGSDVSGPRPDIALGGAIGITALMFLIIMNISQFDGAFFIFDLWSIRLACPVFVASFIGLYFVPWELTRPVLRRVLKYLVMPFMTGLIFFVLMVLRGPLVAANPEEYEIGFEIIWMLPFGQILFFPMVLVIFIISRMVDNSGST